MMAPVVVALQRQLQKAGAAAAETPRESAFQVQMPQDAAFDSFISMAAAVCAATA